MSYDKRKNMFELKMNKKMKIAVLALCVLVVLLGILIIKSCSSNINNTRTYKSADGVEIPSFVQQELLSEDSNSRSKIRLEFVKNIVIHYVANPGSTAMDNRNYFAADSTVVNSHFIVGLDGEIIQCVPLNEQAVASNRKNKDSISIEVCHPDESGEFNEKTMESLIELTAWLCEEFGLEPEDVIRHYDITGKMCPLYYVEHEDEWEKFLEKVKDKL